MLEYATTVLGWFINTNLIPFILGLFRGLWINCSRSGEVGFSKSRATESSLTVFILFIQLGSTVVIDRLCPFNPRLLCTPSVSHTFIPFQLDLELSTDLDMFRFRVFRCFR